MESRRRRARARRTPAWQRALDPASRDRLIHEGLPRLLRAARHELTVREADGALPVGEVDPFEVVDRALDEMLPQLSSQGSIARALVGVQHRIPRILDAMVARLQRAREEPVTLDPLDDLDDLDDDALDALMADEVAELADADRARDRVGGALGRRLVDALFELPPERRRVFEAVVMDGWSAEHVGQTFGLSPGGVDAEIARALAALAERLGLADDPGAQPGPGAPRATEARRLYEALGERLRDEQAASYFSPGHAT